MRYLPLERETMVKELLEKLEKECRADLDEPCNCGSRVRHNNGGNYHQQYTFVKDQHDGGYYIKEDTTCELEPPAPWRETTLQEIESIARDALASW